MLSQNDGLSLVDVPSVDVYADASSWIFFWINSHSRTWDISHVLEKAVEELLDPFFNNIVQIQQMGEITSANVHFFFISRAYRCRFWSWWSVTVLPLPTSFSVLLPGTPSLLNFFWLSWINRSYIFRYRNIHLQSKTLHYSCLSPFGSFPI